MGVHLVLENMDEMRKDRIKNADDFLVTKHTTIRKEMKNRGEDTIYSSKYGTSWDDKDAFQELYSCECGATSGKFKQGVVCTAECKKEVKYTGNNIEVTGWLVLEDAKLIHPNIYAYLESIIGKDELLDIVKSPMADINGHMVISEGFQRMGMTRFTEEWKSVLDYYIKKKPNKRPQYEYIVQNKDKMFTSSIPVFSLVLRPVHSSNVVYSSKANDYYNPLSKDVKDFNTKRSLMTFLEREDKLEEIQLYFNKVYDYCLKSIASKEGHIRSNNMGARFNSSTRTVIVPLGEGCDIDEIEIPYISFLEVYKLEIISILKRVRAITHNSALKIWRKAKFEFSKEVYNIMMMMIKKTEGGVKYLINRNPSIRYGSILMMRIRHVEPILENYVMKIPLQVLIELNADFDGDALNGMGIKSKDILQALEVNNPKYNMVISRNNGLLANDSFLIKDQVTILSDLCNLPYMLQKKKEIENSK
ncbi:MAG: hypothetical protein ACRC0G_07500 [Fusobacteriaceae bacterium]